MEDVTGDAWLISGLVARFDRHFVRDLTWSRHQLEELANRRFMAAQRGAQDDVSFGGESADDMTAGGGSLGADDNPGTTFAKLFKQVRGPADGPKP